MHVYHYIRILIFISESGTNSDNEDEDDEEDGSYLHPSLFASKKSSRLEELMKVSISLLSYKIAVGLIWKLSSVSLLVCCSCFFLDCY